MAGDVVYLLGAGFSKAIGSDMPVMSELARAVRSDLESNGTPLPPETDHFGHDLEGFLTYLADNQPWLEDPGRLRNRAAFGEVSLAISRILDAAQRHTVQQPCPTWLTDLLTHWDRTRSTVITFNYDVLIEAATGLLWRGSNYSWSSFYRAPVVPAAQRVGAVLGGDWLAPITLLKLHGSLTWYWSGIDSSPSDQIYDAGLKRGWSHEGLESPYKNTLEMLVADKVPMVIPPVTTKSRFYDNGVLTSQWKQAAKALRSAQDLVIIGYSLPVSDNVTRSLLVTNFRGRTVTPVDASHGVVTNVETLWKTPPTINASYVGRPDAVSRFVTAECR